MTNGIIKLGTNVGELLQVGRGGLNLFSIKYFSVIDPDTILLNIYLQNLTRL